MCYIYQLNFILKLMNIIPGKFSMYCKSSKAYLKLFYDNGTCINSTWNGTKIINLYYSMKSAILHFKPFFSNMKHLPQFIL